MSTTTTQHGFKDNQRQSTRVMHPPGGATSDIFNLRPLPTKKGGEEAPSNPEPATDNLTRNPSAAGTLDNRTVSNTSVRMRNRQGAFNPITGEAYSYATDNTEQGTPEKANPTAVDDSSVVQNVTSPASGGKALPVHTSSRVLNPPGGPTTSLW